MSDVGAAVAEGLIAQEFIAATVEVPQVPYGGIVRMGSLAVEMVDHGTMEWAELVGMKLEGEPLRAAINEAVRVHEELGISNLGLRNSMGFAFELVQSGLIRAVSVLARGNNNVEIGPIPPVNPADAAWSAAFLEHRENRYTSMDLFQAVVERLREPSVQEHVTRYKESVASVSRDYSDRDLSSPEVRAAKAAEMDARRSQIMRVVRPAIINSLTSHADTTPGALAFGRALAQSKPSDELISKHFPGRAAA